MLAIIVGKADKKDIKSHCTTVSWVFQGLPKKNKWDATRAIHPHIAITFLQI
jgi:hypothetical protein